MLITLLLEGKITSFFLRTHLLRQQKSAEWFVAMDTLFVAMYIAFGITVIHLIEDAPFLGLFFETSEET